MKVIFNADDFGLTQGVNNGIVKSHQDGVVKSTTMMVGMDAEQNAIELANQNPDLKNWRTSTVYSRCSSHGAPKLNQW